MVTLPLKDHQLAALRRLAHESTMRGAPRRYGDLVRFAVDQYLGALMREPVLEPQRGLPMMLCPPIVERRDDELERLARVVDRAVLHDGLDDVERWESIATALGLGDASNRDELVRAVQELAERSREGANT